MISILFNYQLRRPKSGLNISGQFGMDPSSDPFQSLSLDDDSNDENDRNDTRDRRHARQERLDRLAQSAGASRDSEGTVIGGIARGSGGEDDDDDRDEEIVKYRARMEEPEWYDRPDDPAYLESDRGKINLRRQIYSLNNLYLYSKYENCWENSTALLESIPGDSHSVEVRDLALRSWLKVQEGSTTQNAAFTTKAIEIAKTTGDKNIIKSPGISITAAMVLSSAQEYLAATEILLSALKSRGALKPYLQKFISILSNWAQTIQSSSPPLNGSGDIASLLRTISFLLDPSPLEDDRDEHSNDYVGVQISEDDLKITLGLSDSGATILAGLIRKGDRGALDIVDKKEDKDVRSM